MNEYEQRAAELLDDRLQITKMECATPADQAMYNGMIQMLKALGYDTVLNDGKHLVFDIKEYSF